MAGNAAWLLATQALSKGAGLAFVVIVARALGPRDYGQFSFAVSFVGLFLLAGSNSIELTVIRDVARDHSRLSEVFSSGLLLRATLALAALSLALGLAPLVTTGGRGILVVAILGAALLLDELSTYLGSAYKAFERTALHGAAIVVNRVVSAMLALVVIALGGDLVAVSVAYLLGSLGAVAFAWAGLRRYFPPIRFRDCQRALVRTYLREGLTMTFAGILNSALFRIDVVLLQILKGPLAVGFYGIAYRFFDSFLFVGWSLADITLPRIARAGPGGEAARIFQLGVCLILTFSLPLAVLTPFSSEWLVTKLFSEEFRAAAGAVPWLGAAVGLYGIAYAARVTLVALGRRQAIVAVAAGTLAVNVVANLAVIPTHGFRGAAAVTCLSEMIEASLLVALLARANGGVHLRRLTFVPVAAAGSALVVVAASAGRDATALAVGSAAYLAALAVAGRVLAPDETRRALRILRRRVAAVAAR